MGEQQLPLARAQSLSSSVQIACAELKLEDVASGVSILVVIAKIELTSTTTSQMTNSDCIYSEVYIHKL